MQATRFPIPCNEITGDIKRHQDKATEALYIEGREVSRYSWIIVQCGNPRCIEVTHLTVQAPVTLAYPWGICIYCGRSAATKDHLMPRRWTGDAKRRFVVTVPACGTCNSVLSDTLTWSITERRALCHARLRRKFKKILGAPDRTPEEIDEFEGSLREFVIEQAEKKIAVQEMLRWPTDPGYDERAFAASGIEDPYAIGLILPDDEDLDEWVRNVC